MEIQTAKEQLEIYLGGNMNTCTLTPSAIIDLMQGYAKHVLWAASNLTKDEVCKNQILDLKLKV